MQPQFPTISTPRSGTAPRSGSGILSLMLLFTLSLSFSAAHAMEGFAVARPDGATAAAPATATAPAAMDPDSIVFESADHASQLRLVDVARSTLPVTVIDFELDEFLPTRLEVFDLEGRVVRTLANGLWAKGNHRMAWHHENDHGEKLEKGVYVVRLSTDHVSAGDPTVSR